MSVRHALPYPGSLVTWMKSLQLAPACPSHLTCPSGLPHSHLVAPKRVSSYMQLEDRGSAEHHLEMQIPEPTHQGTVRQHILKEALPGALEELCGWGEGEDRWMCG